MELASLPTPPPTLPMLSCVASRILSRIATPTHTPTRWGDGASDPLPVLPDATPLAALCFDACLFALLVAAQGRNDLGPEGAQHVAGALTLLTGLQTLDLVSAARRARLLARVSEGGPRWGAARVSCWRGCGGGDGHGFV